MYLIRKILDLLKEKCHDELCVQVFIDSVANFVSERAGKNACQSFEQGRNIENSKNHQFSSHKEFIDVLKRLSGWKVREPKRKRGKNVCERLCQQSPPLIIPEKFRIQTSHPADGCRIGQRRKKSPKKSVKGSLSPAKRSATCAALSRPRKGGMSKVVYINTSANSSSNYDSGSFSNIDGAGRKRTRELGTVRSGTGFNSRSSREPASSSVGRGELHAHKSQDGSSRGGSLGLKRSQERTAPGSLVTRRSQEALKRGVGRRRSQETASVSKREEVSSLTSEVVPAAKKGAAASIVKRQTHSPSPNSRAKVEVSEDRSSSKRGINKQKLIKDSLEPIDKDSSDSSASPNESIKTGGLEEVVRPANITDGTIVFSHHSVHLNTDEEFQPSVQPESDQGEASIVPGDTDSDVSKSWGRPLTDEGSKGESVDSMAMVETVGAQDAGSDSTTVVGNSDCTYTLGSQGSAATEPETSGLAAGWDRVGGECSDPSSHHCSSDSAREAISPTGTALSGDIEVNKDEHGAAGSVQLQSDHRTCAVTQISPARDNTVHREKNSFSTVTPVHVPSLSRQLNPGSGRVLETIVAGDEEMEERCGSGILDPATFTIDSPSSENIVDPATYTVSAESIILRHGNSRDIDSTSPDAGVSSQVLNPSSKNLAEEGHAPGVSDDCDLGAKAEILGFGADSLSQTDGGQEHLKDILVEQDGGEAGGTSCVRARDGTVTADVAEPLEGAVVFETEGPDLDLCDALELIGGEGPLKISVDREDVNVPSLYICTESEQNKEESGRDEERLVVEPDQSIEERDVSPQPGEWEDTKGCCQDSAQECSVVERNEESLLRELRQDFHPDPSDSDLVLMREGGQEDGVSAEDLDTMRDSEESSETTSKASSVVSQLIRKGQNVPLNETCDTLDVGTADLAEKLDKHVRHCLKLWRRRVFHSKWPAARESSLEQPGSCSAPFPLMGESMRENGPPNSSSGHMGVEEKSPATGGPVRTRRSPKSCDKMNSPSTNVDTGLVDKAASSVVDELCGDSPAHQVEPQSDSGSLSCSLHSEGKLFLGGVQDTLAEAHSTVAPSFEGGEGEDVSDYTSGKPSLLEDNLSMEIVDAVVMKAPDFEVLHMHLKTEAERETAAVGFTSQQVINKDEVDETKGREPEVEGPTASSNLIQSVNVDSSALDEKIVCTITSDKPLKHRVSIDYKKVDVDGGQSAVTPELQVRIRLADTVAQSQPATTQPFVETHTFQAEWLRGGTERVGALDRPSGGTERDGALDRPSGGTERVGVLDRPSGGTESDGAVDGGEWSPPGLSMVLEPAADMIIIVFWVCLATTIILYELAVYPLT